MKIPNADFLERTKSENLGARLWRLPPLIIGAPEEAEALPGAKVDMSLFYPVDPKQLPRELAGVTWPSSA